MKRPTRYGMPYIGSKNKIARWICDQLPVADNFYDLFCGGCSVTHVQLERDRYKRYFINDILPELPRLFVDAAHGRLGLDFHWVSREEFWEKKDGDPVTAMCWSFGGKRKSYIYGKSNEDFKHDYHTAIVDGNVEPLKRWGYDLTPILQYGDIETRYLQAKPIIKARRKNPVLIEPSQATRLHSVERLQHLEELQHIEELESLSVDYRKVEILPNSTVYCDIPYVSTYNYDGFNHKEFYEWALSREFPVYVSEYWMPDGFTEIAVKEKRSTFSPTDNKTIRLEKLFVQSKFA